MFKKKFDITHYHQEDPWLDRGCRPLSGRLLTWRWPGPDHRPSRQTIVYPSASPSCQLSRANLKWIQCNFPMNPCIAGWAIGWLDGWADGWLVGWLDDWMVGRSEGRSVVSLSNKMQQKSIPYLSENLWARPSRTVFRVDCCLFRIAAASVWSALPPIL